MKLYEELFDTPDDTTLGVTNVIINSINKCWESISDFNGIIATLREHEYEDLIPIIEDIIDTENSNVGKLQQVVEILSPSSDENIDAGKEEAIQTIDTVEPVIESLNESLETDIYSWLDRNYGSSGWKDKFKNYIEKLKESGYNTTNLNKDLGIAIKKYSKQVKVKPQVFMKALEESLINKKNIERNKDLKNFKRADESLTEDVGDSPIYYVSYYEETPEYVEDESLTGGADNDDNGYFVAKRDLIVSEEFTDLDEARKRIAELGEQENMEKVSDEFYLDRSKYIGQDRFFIIETEKGSEEDQAQEM